MLANFHANRIVLHFFIHSKSRWCIFLEKIIIRKKCFFFCQIITVWPQNCTRSTKMNSLQNFEWFSGSCGGVPGLNSQKTIFGAKLWVFFSAMSYVSHIPRSSEKCGVPQKPNIQNKMLIAFLKFEQPAFRICIDILCTNSIFYLASLPKW